MLRQPKIGPFTLFDTGTAFLGVLLLSPLLTRLFAKFNIDVPRTAWLWFTLPLSVLFHLLFGQSTPLMKVITDPGSYQFYVAIAALGLMSYMGLRLCKIHHTT